MQVPYGRDEQISIRTKPLILNEVFAPFLPSRTVADLVTHQGRT